MRGYIITSVHNSLPNNRKSAEISDYMRKLEGVTFTPEEYKDLVEELRFWVNFLNTKYTRTKPFFVRESPSRSNIGVGVEGSAEGLYASMHVIGATWTEYKANR